MGDGEGYYNDSASFEIQVWHTYAILASTLCPYQGDIREASNTQKNPFLLAVKSNTQVTTKCK